MAATERQLAYLRGLGAIDAEREPELDREKASLWIEELEGYRRAANLTPGTALVPGSLLRVGARHDALTHPPSPPPRVPRVTREGPANGHRGSEPAPAEPTGRGDESWWRIELSASVPLGSGQAVEVRVSGSEHRRHGLSLEAGEELARLVERLVLEAGARVRDDPAWASVSAEGNERSRTP